MKRYFLWIIFSLGVIVYVFSQDTVRIVDFGARPYSYENSVEQFRQAIEVCKQRSAKCLYLEPGRYDIWPEGAERREYFISNTSTAEECPSKVKTIGLLFEDMQNLTIEGNGALLMFHGKMTTLAFDRCKNMKVHNLHVDFERPTISEFHCIKATDDEVELSVHPDTRYEIVNERIMLYGEGWRSERYYCAEYDSATDMCLYANAVWNTLVKSPVKGMEHGRIRFKTPVGFNLIPGNIFSVRDIIRDQVGAFICESKNITLSKVYMHYMHGLGIVSQYTENVTMDSVICAPRKGSGRLIASSADMMQFSGCRGKIKIDGCYFSGAHDDPINIHGTNLRIVEQSDSRTLRLRFMHGQSYGFNAYFPGDEVAFVRPSTLKRYASAKVEAVKHVSDKEVEIRLAENAPQQVDIGVDCMENITWTPEVEIRNSYFTHAQTRGTLVTTPRRVVIENNIYHKIGKAAILIEGDAMYWFESGPVCDVLIKGNTFIDCGSNNGPGNAIIALNPSNSLVGPKYPVHKNVRIENNVFKTFDYPVLYAKSVGNLVFKDNIVERTYTRPPLSTNKYTFYLNGCSDVVIRGTRFQKDVLGQNIFLENMKKKDLKTDISQ